MTFTPDFEEFYRDMHPRLWAFLVRVSGRPDLAEEIAQEAFVRLLASRGATLPEDARRAYLFRIAQNLLHDAHRRRRVEIHAEDTKEPAGPEPPDPLSRTAAAALSSLTERERRLLWLAHVEGWSHHEIARLLGLASGSVRVLLHRARLRFRNTLEGKRP